MKSLHIRDLPEDTLLGLKRRAQRHHRSLQKEVRSLLEEAARMQPADEETSATLRLKRVRTGNSGRWSREEIYGDDGR